MTDIIFTQNGISHRISSPEGLQKALGNVSNQNIIMVDETGALVGAGNNLGAVEQSKPLFKALKENRPMLKGQASKPAPRAIFAKGMNSMVRELESLKKGFSVTVADDSDLSNDELAAIAIDLQERVETLEASVGQILGYLGALAVKGILPAEA